MKLKVIITGATGMVGEGVLLECLSNPAVESVLVVNRKSGEVTHPQAKEKLKEIVHSDFYNLSAIESQLNGYNACFFCLGTSSVGKSKEEYKKITYDLTLNFANVLAKFNPNTSFCYVTGSGTDSTEKGPMKWARVKGATENALLKIFKNGFMFRPGFMLATKGQKNLKLIYKCLEWVYPIGRKLYPAMFCTLKEVGQAMINISANASANASTKGSTKHILEVKDIVELAK